MDFQRRLKIGLANADKQNSNVIDLNVFLILLIDSHSEAHWKSCTMIKEAAFQLDKCEWEAGAAMSISVQLTG